MGLTWIDHDTIEKPIEEFTGDEDAKEIEFTVTTLNCEKKVSFYYLVTLGIIIFPKSIS